MLLTFSFRQSAGCGVNQSQLKMLYGGERERERTKDHFNSHTGGHFTEWIFNQNFYTTQKVLGAVQTKLNSDIFSYNIKLTISV